MTSKEFNEKYKNYLEEGHYGMSIEDPIIIAICDVFFGEWITISDFKYSQIKIKLGSSRVYCKNDDGYLWLLEECINAILKEKKNE